MLSFSFRLPKSAFLAYGENKLNLGKGAPRDGQGQPQQGQDIARRTWFLQNKQTSKQNLNQADFSAQPEHIGQKIPEKTALLLWIAL